MLKRLCRCKVLMTEHPGKINETYIEHFLCASHMAKEMAKISTIMMIHAICPFLYETTASDKLKELNDKIQKRKECQNG